jgi:hypothetical protein
MARSAVGMGSLPSGAVGSRDDRTLFPPSAARLGLLRPALAANVDLTLGIYSCASRRGTAHTAVILAAFGFASAVWQPSLACSLDNPLVFSAERRVVGGS